MGECPPVSNTIVSFLNKCLIVSFEFRGKNVFLELYSSLLKLNAETFIFLKVLLSFFFLPSLSKWESHLSREAIRCKGSPYRYLVDVQKQDQNTL